MKKNYKKIEIVFRSLEISGDVWIKQCKKPTPSALGHYLIANEILIKLFNDYSEPTSFSLDACDNFTIQKKYKKFVLNPNSFHHYWTTKDRIENLWVVSSLTTLYSSEYYQYFLNNFKQKAIDKRNYCNIKHWSQL